jgi:hypothetical protein
MLPATYNLEFLALFGLALASENTHFLRSFIHLENSQTSLHLTHTFGGILRDSNGRRYLWHGSPFFSLG